MTQNRLPLHLHPRPVRALCARPAASPAAWDLYRARYVLAALTMVVVALTIAFTTRGQMLTWDGWQDVTPPTPPASCGDYCGTDAGFSAA